MVLAHVGGQHIEVLVLHLAQHQVDQLLPELLDLHVAVELVGHGIVVKLIGLVLSIGCTIIHVALP